MKLLRVILALLTAFAPSLALASDVWKQSTAINVPVLMVDSGDHVTGKTGLSAGLTIKASKDGGAFSTITPTVTELGGGTYKLALTTSHTDTLGYLWLQITATGADQSDLKGLVRANILGDTLPVNVTQFGGTAGTFASGIPSVHKLSDTHVFYVDDTGSDSNSGLTPALAKLTLAGAVSAAIEGDTIKVLPGTYTATTTISKNGLTIEGTDRDGCTLTYNSGYTLNINSRANITLRRLSIVASAEAGSPPGTGLNANSTNCLTIENCTINGKNDGAEFNAANGLMVRGTSITGTFDSCNLTDTRGTFERCVFTTAGTFSTTSIDTRGVYISSSQTDTLVSGPRVTFNNCDIVALQLLGTHTGSCIGMVACGVVDLYNTRITVTGANASYNGSVIGLQSHDSTKPAVVYMQGGYIKQSTLGSGSTYDIVSTATGAKVELAGVAYDSSKLSGTSIKETLRAATPGRYPVIDAAGLADATAVKVGPSGSGTAQTAADLGASATANGTAIANVAAGVSANATNINNVANTVSALPSASANASALLDAVLSGHTTSGTVGKALGYLDAAVSSISGGSSTPDTRDLAPVQHTWQLKRSGDGTLRSTNPIVLHAGDANVRCGWNCDTPQLLPPGTVISAQGACASSDNTSGVDVTDIGHDAKVAKVELDVDADAAVATYWISTTVTNSAGGGPITIYGEVQVQAGP